MSSRGGNEIVVREVFLSSASGISWSEHSFSHRVSRMEVLITACEHVHKHEAFVLILNLGVSSLSL